LAAFRTGRDRAMSYYPEVVVFGLLLLLQAGTLSAQSSANAVHDRVILGGHVMDPASQLDAVLLCF